MIVVVLVFQNRVLNFLTKIKMKNVKMLIFAVVVIGAVALGFMTLGGGGSLQGKLEIKDEKSVGPDLFIQKSLYQVASHTVLPGKKDLEIAKFRISPFDESLTVDWFSFWPSGKNGVSTFENLRLVREDDSIITQNVKIDSGYIYFKGPFQLDANSGVIVKILADVSSETKAGTYSLYYRDITGTYLNKPGAFTGPVYGDLEGSKVTVVSKGTATLAKDPASPSGSVDLGSKNVVLGRFTVTAKGEDIQLKKVALDFSRGVDRRTNGPSNVTGYFDCVTSSVHDTSCDSRTDVIDSIQIIREEGNYVLYTSPSNRLNFWNNSPTYVALDYFDTIKAGTTGKLKIVGSINSAVSDTGAGENITVGIKKFYYYTKETNKYAETGAAFANKLSIK